MGIPGAATAASTASTDDWPAPPDGATTSGDHGAGAGLHAHREAALKVPPRNGNSDTGLPPSRQNYRTLQGRAPTHAMPIKFVRDSDAGMFKQTQAWVRAGHAFAQRRGAELSAIAQAGERVVAAVRQGLTASDTAVAQPPLAKHAPIDNPVVALDRSVNRALANTSFEAGPLLAKAAVTYGAVQLGVAPFLAVVSVAHFAKAAASGDGHQFGPALLNLTVQGLAGVALGAAFSKSGRGSSAAAAEAETAAVGVAEAVETLDVPAMKAYLNPQAYEMLAQREAQADAFVIASLSKAINRVRGTDRAIPDMAKRIQSLLTSGGDASKLRLNPRETLCGLQEAVTVAGRMLTRHAGTRDALQPKVAQFVSHVEQHTARSPQLELDIVDYIDSVRQAARWEAALNALKEATKGAPSSF